jgi:hypothetical protein
MPTTATPCGALKDDQLVSWGTMFYFKKRLFCLPSRQHDIMYHVHTQIHSHILLRLWK